MTTGRINQVAAILRTPPAAPSRKQPTPAKGIRRPKPHDWMSVVLAWKGIHLRAGLLLPTRGEPQPAPLSVFARLSIQPRRRRRCGTQARFVEKGAGVPVGGPVALAADRAEQAPSFAGGAVQAEPASQQGFPWFSIRLAHRVSAQAPSTSVTDCFTKKAAGPNGRRLFRLEPPRPSTEKGVGSRPTRRRSHAARSGPAAPHCHSPPTSGTSLRRPVTGAPAASLLVSSSATDWSPASPSSGLVCRF